MTISCHCVPGYSGDRCEKNADDCKVNKCHPEAKCVDILRGYKCECPPHRIDQFCQFENPCFDVPKPCNDGVCVPLPHTGSFKCSCTSFFTGPDCSTDINECASPIFPCQHGKCINTHGGFHCEFIRSVSSGPPNFTAPHSTTTPTVETKTTSRALDHGYRADASHVRAVDAPSGMTDVPLTTWFHEARHLEQILGEPVQNNDREEWRKIKDRMKTVSVALVLCLNIGVDPPDVIKPQPCARREAWLDPALMNPLKVPQRVAIKLQKAYERLQPRARYKSAVHPTAFYFNRVDCFSHTTLKHSVLVNQLRIGDTLPYTSFFIEQLKAFDAWLQFDAMRTEPPDQLPVVLQVLLSQVHRVTALELLARYLDMNTKAVLDALFVGVFPYVLKLLQSTATELRPSLAFIWAKILTVDPKCCEDLLTDGYRYFLDIIRDKDVAPRHKIIPVFVICTLMKHCLDKAQEKFHTDDYLEIVIDLLSQYDVRACKMLCVWLLISLGMLWHNNDPVRWQAVRIIAPETVSSMLHDEVPEVRAAGIYALGLFMSNRAAANEHAYTLIITRVEQIEQKVSSQVKFTIGSPNHNSIPLPTDAVSVVDSHRRHALSRTRTHSSGGEQVSRTLEGVETPPVTLTPKRRVNDRDGSRHSSLRASSAPTLDPVIKTEFVEGVQQAHLSHPL